MLSTSTSWCKRAAHRRCSATAAAAAAAAAARDTAAAAAAGEARYALTVEARVTFGIFFRTVRGDLQRCSLQPVWLLAYRLSGPRQPDQSPHPGGSSASPATVKLNTRDRLALSSLTHISNVVLRKVITLRCPRS